MARIDKGALTKLEIITEATKQFLEKGYTNTSANAVAKALGMSQGNLTFHYPTKEHLLAILVDMLCDYQWKRMEQEANDGISSVMAICLELTSMASACEHDDAEHHCPETDACTEQGGKYKFESLFHSCMVWSSYPVCLHKYKGI